MPRKVTGIRRRRGGWRVDVRVQGRLYTKQFPLDTPVSAMTAWRERTASEIHLGQQLAAIEAKRLPRSLTGWCYVYFARSGDVVKIGRAIEPSQRLRELQTTHAGELVLLATVAGHMALEGALHARFAHLRTRAKGEWFRLEPDLVAFIQLIQQGANPVALLFEDPRVVLGWQLLPRRTDDSSPCDE